MVRTYVANPGLLSIHNAIRVNGINTIPTTLSYESLFAYGTGVLTPAICMLIIGLLAVVAVLVAACCARHQQRCTALLLACCLIIVTSTSIVIAYSASLPGSYDAIYNSMINVVNKLEEVEAEFETNRLVLVTLREAANATIEECKPFYDASPSLSVVDSIFSVLDQIATVSISATVASYIDIYAAIAHSIIYSVYVAYVTTYSVILALAVFASVTLLVGCPKRSCIILVLLLLGLIVAWIGTALVHATVTIGSDICTPHIDTNILVFLPAGLLYDTTLYYQTCKGDNPLLSTVPRHVQLLPIGENDAVTVNNTVNFILDSFAPDPIPEAFQDIIQLRVCANTAIGFQNTINVEIGNALDRIERVLGCKEINALYAELAYDGVCNGIVLHVYAMFVSAILVCCFASFGLLLASI